MGSTENYHVSECIGEGSFGRVFKGRRKFSGQVVALKFIPKLNKNEKELRSLRQEIAILRGLKHENIITMMDAFETPTDFCVVTEYAQGDIFQIIEDEEQHCLPESEVRLVARQLVRALEYLHSNRIIHRDMKPQNILVGDDGQIKLCDFGFARTMSYDTLVVTSIKGTPLYMAPEVVQEQPYNHTADLWSLGVILYELFAGRPPFHTNNLYALITLIVKEKVRFPPNMSPAFRNLLEGLLNKTPSERLSWPDLANHPFISDGVPMPVPEEPRAAKPAETARSDARTAERIRAWLARSATPEGARAIAAESGLVASLLDSLRGAAAGDVDETVSLSASILANVAEHAQELVALSAGHPLAEPRALADTLTALAAALDQHSHAAEEVCGPLTRLLYALLQRADPRDVHEGELLPALAAVVTRALSRRALLKWAVQMCSLVLTWPALSAPAVAVRAALATPAVVDALVEAVEAEDAELAAGAVVACAAAVWSRFPHAGFPLAAATPPHWTAHRERFQILPLVVASLARRKAVLACLLEFVAPAARADHRVASLQILLAVCRASPELCAAFVETRGAVANMLLLTADEDHVTSSLALDLAAAVGRSRPDADLARWAVGLGVDRVCALLLSEAQSVAGASAGLLACLAREKKQRDEIARYVATHLDVATAAFTSTPDGSWDHTSGGCGGFAYSGRFDGWTALLLRCLSQVDEALARDAPRGALYAELVAVLDADALRASPDPGGGVPSLSPAGFLATTRLLREVVGRGKRVAGMFDEDLERAALSMLAPLHLRALAAWPEACGGGDTAATEVAYEVLCLLHLPFAPRAAVPEEVLVVIEQRLAARAIPAVIGALARLDATKWDAPMALTGRLVLSSDAAGREFVAAGGLDRELVRRLTESPSQVVSTELLLILSHLARPSAEHYAVLQAADPCGYLARALVDEDSNIRSHACSVVGNLCRHSGLFYADLQRHGCVERLLALCRDAESSVRRFAVFAVGNLAFHSDVVYPHLRSAIGDLVALMHDRDAKTRENAAGALGNLARNSLVLCHDLQRGAAIPVLLDALTDAAPVQRVALFSLGTLAASPACRSEMIASRAVSKAEPLCGSADARVQKYARRLLAALREG